MHRGEGTYEVIYGNSLELSLNYTQFSLTSRFALIKKGTIELAFYKNCKFCLYLELEQRVIEIECYIVGSTRKPGSSPPVSQGTCQLTFERE